MSSFFDRVFGRKTEGSSSKAKDRLQFVLVHDRINLPPERMQEMKEEILAVISKYVTVDRGSVDIALEQRDHRNSKLVAEIPVIQQRVQPMIDEDDDLKVKASSVTASKAKVDPSPAKEASDSDKTAKASSEASAQVESDADKRGDSTPKMLDNDASLSGAEESSSGSSDDAGTSGDSGSDSSSDID